jgi:sigma-E factor negative regulatory protein RseA
MMGLDRDLMITRTVMEILMDTHKKNREHISALSDGELSASDLELAFAALRAADGEQAWITYHRIGGVLRAQATPELSDGFNQRLTLRLAAEPAHSRRAAAAQAPAEAQAAGGGARKVVSTTS